MELREMNKIASLVAKLEGGKTEARIGDICQILSLLADLEEQTAAYNPENKTFEMGIVSKALINAAARKAQAEYAPADKVAQDAPKAPLSPVQ